MCYAVMTLCGISVTLCFRGQKLVLRRGIFSFKRDYLSDFKRDGLRSCYLIFLTNVS